MNIFATDPDPLVCARNLADPHIVNQPRENAQMACTNARLFGARLDPADGFHKSTHENHGSTVWIRRSHENAEWALDYFIAVAGEYTHRYGKVHADEAQTIIAMMALLDSGVLPRIGLTPMYQAMPEGLRRSNPFEAYKSYLRVKYDGWARDWRAPCWTRRPIPDFLRDRVNDYRHKEAR